MILEDLEGHGLPGTPESTKVIVESDLFVNNHKIILTLRAIRLPEPSRFGTFQILAHRFSKIGSWEILEFCLLVFTSPC